MTVSELITHYYHAVYDVVQRGRTGGGVGGDEH